MVVYTALLVICMASLALSEDTNVEERIYNGFQATRGQIPYQARCVQKKANGDISFCGGTLISPTWILSAGHCAVDAVSVTVYLGLVDAKNLSGVLTYNVGSSGIVRNPTYNQTNQQNDMVLYQLPSAVPLADYPYISVIGLPRRSQNAYFFDNYNGTISGWGLVNNTSGMPQYLQYAPAHVMPHKLCEKYYYPPYPITDGMVCVDKTVIQTGTCGGDSGGPLAVKGTDGNLIVIGATSWGTSCTSKDPNVFGFPGKILDWISQTTGIPIQD